jgi:hypothetical protein
MLSISKSHAAILLSSGYTRRLLGWVCLLRWVLGLGRIGLLGWVGLWRIGLWLLWLRIGVVGDVWLGWLGWGDGLLLNLAELRLMAWVSVAAVCHGGSDEENKDDNQKNPISVLVIIRGKSQET